MVRIREITWEEYLEDVKKLALIIKESNFKPDVIVAVARGGFVPARVISDIIGVDLILTIVAKAYKGIGRKSKVVIIQSFDCKHIIGKDVLVVDDIVDSGETMVKVLEFIYKCSPREVRSATVYHKPWSKIVPDYYIKTVKDWIVFPYEKEETIRLLAKEASTLSRARK